MSGDRIECIVPFCPRTAGRNTKRFAAAPPELRASDIEWICAEHWRGVPKPYRNVYARLRRRGHGDSARSWRIWSRLKAAAVAGAAGFR